MPNVFSLWVFKIMIVCLSSSKGKQRLFVSLWTDAFKYIWCFNPLHLLVFLMLDLSHLRPVGACLNRVLQPFDMTPVIFESFFAIGFDKIFQTSVILLTSTESSPKEHFHFCSPPCNLISPVLPIEYRVELEFLEIW